MKKLLTAGVAAAAVMTFGGSAVAQASQTIEVDPASVEAAGSADITVSLGGFTAGATVFVLPCSVPASGNAADIGDGDCDTAQLSTLVVEGDGTASVSVTYEVPDGGLVVAASDAAGEERAQLIITVGAAASGADAQTDGDDDDDGDGDEAAGGDGSLPDTGGELTLALLGAGLLAVGGSMVMWTRRNEPLAFHVD